MDKSGVVLTSAVFLGLFGTLSLPVTADTYPEVASDRTVLRQAHDVVIGRFSGEVSFEKRLYRGISTDDGRVVDYVTTVTLYLFTICEAVDGDLKESTIWVAAPTGFVESGENFTAVEMLPTEFDLGLALEACSGSEIPECVSVYGRIFSIPTPEGRQAFIKATEDSRSCGILDSPEFMELMDVAATLDGGSE